MARANQYFIFIVLAVSYLQEIHGHGMLMDPINRGSAWRVGYKTPVNKDDDGNYCGGIQVSIKNIKNKIKKIIGDRSLILFHCKRNIIWTIKVLSPNILRVFIPILLLY